MGAGVVRHGELAGRAAGHRDLRRLMADGAVLRGKFGSHWECCGQPLADDDPATCREKLCVLNGRPPLCRIRAMPERITKQLLAVLEVFIGDPGREWYGLEVMNGAKLSSGTLYPILHRLVEDGWLLRTRDVASEAGGPGRRLYQLTGVGEKAATELLASRRPRPQRAPVRLRPRTQPA